ncbi:MAG: GNAT family N-acetyltransferase [Candidatus Limnocylindrales bacterium]
MIRVALISTGDADWQATLRRAPHDVYHTAGYHQFAELSGEGRAHLAVVSDGPRGVAWPYLLRPVAVPGDLATSTARDVTSVYGYPGPVAWGCAPGDAFLVRAWREIVQVWRTQGAVSAFTRFHPVLENAALLPDDAWRLAADDHDEHLVAGGQTVSIDCTLDDESASAGYAPNLRRAISAARRDGLTSTHDDDWAGFTDFVRLYRDTMRRNGADAYYLFEIGDFLALRRAIGEHLHLFVTTAGHAIIAAGLFTEYGGIVQAHLVGTDEAQLRHSPYKLLVDDVRRWAHVRGDPVFHLGGGRGGRDDNLMLFKTRFSDRRHRFYTGRWILNRATYGELVVARWPRKRERALRANGFFPAYREPVAPEDSPL